MNRMPCSISDDPYNDYSDFVEEQGVYKPFLPPNPDDKRDVQFALNKGLEPLITPHVNDKTIEQ